MEPSYQHWATLSASELGLMQESQKKIAPSFSAVNDKFQILGIVKAKHVSWNIF